MTVLSDLTYIDESGFHYEDYPTFLSWLQDEYKAIYGADVYLEADSQDGQFLAIIARALYDSAALGASVYNSRSPTTSQGVGLSSVVKINGIRRRIATNSTVDLDIGGQVGTIITNGVAEDTLGQKWLLPASVTIPISGSITVTATAEEVGEVSAQVGTITKIFTPTLGWQTVDNAAVATEGVAVETDAELRIRQTESVALPSLSVFEGTVGAVKNVDGVTRVQGYENDSNITDSDGIPAHNISIVAEGGDVAEIAEAIAIHKTPGTGTYGTTSETVFDEYGVPNVINFYRPTIVDVEVEVTIEAFTGYSSAFADEIKAAVAAAINILAIGKDVLITKLYVPANLPGTSQGATFDIVSIEIAKSGDPLAASNIDILFNEAAQCVVGDVTVTVVP
jgi:uncharacterized phage protein gp47/JayE